PVVDEATRPAAPAPRSRDSWPRPLRSKMELKRPPAEAVRLLGTQCESCTHDSWPTLPASADGFACLGKLAACPTRFVRQDESTRVTKVYTGWLRRIRPTRRSSRSRSRIRSPN